MAGDGAIKRTSMHGKIWQSSNTLFTIKINTSIAVTFVNNFVWWNHGLMTKHVLNASQIVYNYRPTTQFAL